MVLPQGGATCRHTFLAMLDAERATWTSMGLALFRQRYAEFGVLAKRLASYQAKMEASAPAPPVCQRLEPIPGVGPLPATALRAAVREVSACQNGRQVAAWLGLGPRQPATGGKARCRGSRTRGAGSWRPLLVHGARATLRGGGLKPERRRKGGRALMERRGKTKPAVARAHKHAPMAWVLLNRDPTYRA
jgi:transposase